MDNVYAIICTKTVYPSEVSNINFIHTEQSIILSDSRERAVDTIRNKMKNDISIASDDFNIRGSKGMIKTTVDNWSLVSYNGDFEHSFVRWIDSEERYVEQSYQLVDSPVYLRTGV